MKKLWNRIKNDKVLLGIFILVCIALVVDILIIAFDITQFIIIANNRAGLSSQFAVFNIVGSIVNLLAVMSVVLYIVLRKK